MAIRTPVSRDEVLALAAQRHGDPAAALDVVTTLLGDGGIDADTASIAHWVRGLALHELDRLDEAEAEFRSAIALATSHGLADAEARARGNLAISLLQQGAVAEARRELTLAREVAPPSATGPVLVLAALFEQRTGRHDEALRLYELALPHLNAAADTASLGVLHLNRGVIYAYRGRFGAARRDRGQAERIAAAEDLLILGAMAAHNLGFAEGRRGRLADALLALDRAEDRYRRQQNATRQLPVLHTDRAEVMLLAGLSDDARIEAQAAVDGLLATNNVADLHEARLLLARACLATGDPAEAKRHAIAAARGLRATQRTQWAGLALYVGVQAQLDAVDGRTRASSRLLERCARIAALLARSGWPVEARDLRCWAARLATAAGDVGRADTELREARSIRSRGAAAHRANYWVAVAQSKVAAGDGRGARTSLRRGLAEIQRLGNVATGAVEVRTARARFTGELAQLGIDLAVASGRGLETLRWAERQRASALRFSSVPAPSSSPVARDLAELRATTATTATAATADYVRHRTSDP